MNWRVGVLATAAGLAVAAACADQQERLQLQSAAAAEVPDPIVPGVYAVQLGMYADSSRAVRTARALADSGWNPVVHPVRAGEAKRWNVYIAVTPDSLFPEFVASGVRVAWGGEAIVVRDSFPTSQLAGAPLVSQVVPVLRFDERMTARTRWALSPDSTALVAVQDPAGELNEPAPNGAVFASEALNCYAPLDSVWDVTPSPQWDRLAIGRAYTLTAEAGGEASEMERALATQLRITEDTVRSAGFGVGRAPVRRGFVHPVVIDLTRGDSVPSSDEALALRSQALPMLGGWRLRWANGGRTLAVGANPVARKDDARPRAWTAVPDSGTPHALPRGSAAALRGTKWVQGPVLDPSLPVRLTENRKPVAGGRVTTVGGWIRLADGRGRGRIIGPGVPLAVTRSGSFVLALAPQPATLRDAPTAQLVLYATRAREDAPPPARCRTVDVPG